MSRRLLRLIAISTILPLSVGAATYYFTHHPEVGRQLSGTSPVVIAGILGLYIVGIVALAMVTVATVRLCQINLRSQESLLLTAYSSIVNFFGPLQSGPAFRAVYLKSRHKLNLRKYAGASLLYYFFYGSMSLVLLLSGVLKWWLLPVIAAGWLAAFFARKLSFVAARLRGLNTKNWQTLAAATALQLLIVTIIYYVELRTVAPGTHLSQAIIYSGAASLSLFVSLTPGAIGFRESFLLFSQNLHHINSSTIVAANILDRALYIVLLLGLAVAIFATHARRQLRIN